MDEYLVPFETAVSEFTEKRSRFLSHIWRVESEAEAKARIEEMKKQYYDARHNCWCYLLHEGGVLRYSDNGEPQGTAGQPMLEVFRREGVSNVCCVVTRYFGGILLGAGGLTRAYARGAKDALDAAGVSRVRRWTRVEIVTPYPLFERLRLELQSFDAVLEDPVYGAEVTVTALLGAERLDAFQTRLTELSSGTMTARALEEVDRPGPRERAK